MDYDFGHMGAAAKNFNAESFKEKESQAMYDAADSMEHDGIQSNQIPDSDPYRQVFYHRRLNITTWHYADAGSCS